MPIAFPVDVEEVAELAFLVNLGNSDDGELLGDVLIAEDAAGWDGDLMTLEDGPSIAATFAFYGLVLIVAGNAEAFEQVYPLGGGIAKQVR